MNPRLKSGSSLLLAVMFLLPLGCASSVSRQPDPLFGIPAPTQPTWTPVPTQAPKPVPQHSWSPAQEIKPAPAAVPSVQKETKPAPVVDPVLPVPAISPLEHMKKAPTQPKSVEPQIAPSTEETSRNPLMPQSEPPAEARMNFEPLTLAYVGGGVAALLALGYFLFVRRKKQQN